MSWKTLLDKVIPAFGIGFRLFVSGILSYQVAGQKIWELVDAGKDEFSTEELNEIIREANEEAKEISEREGLEFIDIVGEDDKDGSFDDFLSKF